MTINLTLYIKDSKLSLKVTPNASKTEMIEENGGLKLYLKTPPVKGKANSEVVKFFKKEYRLKIEIISGNTSRNKTIRILE